MSVREHWINVRVNPEELARIREKQKELGIRNTGAYMRKMAMDGYCVNLDLSDVAQTAYQEKQSEQSKMEDQLMEMVGGSESNVWKLYESIMCVYFDMEEIIKQAVYLQGAYDRERMLK